MEGRSAEGENSHPERLTRKARVISNGHCTFIRYWQLKQLEFEHKCTIALQGLCLKNKGFVYRFCT